MQDLPFLNLSGPEFLNVFGVVAIIVLGVAFVVIRLADKTGKRPPPPVPQSPDAIEVAFLQGGVNQVVRMTVYDLVQKGYAALAPDDRIAPTGKTPEPGALNVMETRVLELVQAKPKAHALFENRAQRKGLLNLLAPVRAKLAAEELIKPEPVKTWRRRAQIVGTLVLLGFAGAKVYVDMSEGRSVAYLIFLCIAAILSLFALAYVLTRSHASQRGRAYLDAMELAYRPRLDSALLELGAPTRKAFDGASLFLIGLYGFSVLEGTPEAAFASHFRRASSEGGGGGCGSSCAGSCGDGSGGGD